MLDLALREMDHWYGEEIMGQPLSLLLFIIIFFFLLPDSLNVSLCFLQ